MNNASSILKSTKIKNPHDDGLICLQDLLDKKDPSLLIDAVIELSDAQNAEALNALLSYNFSPPFFTPHVGNILLARAAHQGNIIAIKAFLPLAAPDDINKAIFEAAKNGQRDAVELLLPMFDENKSGDDLPMNVRSCVNHPEIFQMLFKKLENITNQEKIAAECLSIATAINAPESVKMLMPFASKKSLKEAVSFASVKGYNQIIEILLKSFKSPRSVVNEGFAIAALNNQMATVDYLLTLAKPNPRECDEALRLATAEGHVKMCERLIPLVKNPFAVMTDPKSRIHPNVMHLVELVRADMDHKALSAGVEQELVSKSSLPAPKSKM